MINTPSTFTALFLGLSFNNPEKTEITIRISPINMSCNMNCFSIIVSILAKVYSMTSYIKLLTDYTKMVEDGV